MDRTARIISLVVAVFAVAIAVYLAWNPRGVLRPGGWLFFDADTSTTTMAYDPAQAIGETDGPVRGRAQFDSARLREHLTRLYEKPWEIGGEELRAVADLADDALRMLRPYWLHDELRAVVRVGGQLVGDISALGSIAVDAVDIVRLEFSPSEPHWIIQIHMR